MNGVRSFTGGLTIQHLLRLCGLLFLLAAVAFAFSPIKWMAIVEGVAGIVLLVGSFRVSTPPVPPARRPPRRRGRP
jgi:hypothetical protein